MASSTLRYQEEIGGRVYQIEVSRVARSGWRAQLMTVYGSPAALMPFYGDTPEDAVRDLSAWLARAHKVPVQYARHS
jgi:hypothetical protein